MMNGLVLVCCILLATSANALQRQTGPANISPNDSLLLRGSTPNKIAESNYFQQVKYPQLPSWWFFNYLQDYIGNILKRYDNMSILSHTSDGEDVVNDEERYFQEGVLYEPVSKAGVLSHNFLESNWDYKDNKNQRGYLWMNDIQSTESPGKSTEPTFVRSEEKVDVVSLSYEALPMGSTSDQVNYSDGTANGEREKKSQSQTGNVELFEDEDKREEEEEDVKERQAEVFPFLSRDWKTNTDKTKKRFKRVKKDEILAQLVRRRKERMEMPVGSNDISYIEKDLLPSNAIVEDEDDTKLAYETSLPFVHRYQYRLNKRSVITSEKKPRTKGNNAQKQPHSTKINFASLSPIARVYTTKKDLGRKRNAKLVVSTNFPKRHFYRFARDISSAGERRHAQKHGGRTHPSKNKEKRKKKRPKAHNTLKKEGKDKNSHALKEEADEVIKITRNVYTAAQHTNDNRKEGKNDSSDRQDRNIFEVQLVRHENTSKTPIVAISLFTQELVNHTETSTTVQAFTESVVDARMNNNITEATFQVVTENFSAVEENNTLIPTDFPNTTILLLMENMTELFDQIFNTNETDAVLWQDETTILNSETHSMVEPSKIDQPEYHSVSTENIRNVTVFDDILTEIKSINKELEYDSTIVRSSLEDDQLEYHSGENISISNENAEVATHNDEEENEKGMNTGDVKKETESFDSTSVYEDVTTEFDINSSGGDTEANATEQTFLLRDATQLPQQHRDVNATNERVKITDETLPENVSIQNHSRTVFDNDDIKIGITSGPENDKTSFPEYDTNEPSTNDTVYEDEETDVRTTDEPITRQQHMFSEVHVTTTSSLDIEKFSSMSEDDFTYHDLVSNTKVAVNNQSSDDYTDASDDKEVHQDVNDEMVKHGVQLEEKLKSEEYNENHDIEGNEEHHAIGTSTEAHMNKVQVLNLMEKADDSDTITGFPPELHTILTLKPRRKKNSEPKLTTEIKELPLIRSTAREKTHLQIDANNLHQNSNASSGLINDTSSAVLKNDSLIYTTARPSFVNKTDANLTKEHDNIKNSAGNVTSSHRPTKRKAGTNVIKKRENGNKRHQHKKVVKGKKHVHKPKVNEVRNKSRVRNSSKKINIKSKSGIPKINHVKPYKARVAPPNRSVPSKEIQQRTQRTISHYSPSISTNHSNSLYYESDDFDLDKLSENPHKHNYEKSGYQHQGNTGDDDDYLVVRVNPNDPLDSETILDPFVTRKPEPKPVKHDQQRPITTTTMKPRYEVTTKSPSATTTRKYVAAITDTMKKPKSPRKKVTTPATDLDSFLEGDAGVATEQIETEGEEPEVDEQNIEVFESGVRACSSDQKRHLKYACGWRGNTAVKSGQSYTRTDFCCDSWALSTCILRTLNTMVCAMDADLRAFTAFNLKAFSDLGCRATISLKPKICSKRKA